VPVAIRFLLWRYCNNVRKNVGGIMSEEIFSYTNTGEPKHITMEEFVKEVVTTLHWVTDKAIQTSVPMESLNMPWSVETAAEEKEAYKNGLQIKVMQEKNKVRCYQVF
jgi:hypothetical protein